MLKTKEEELNENEKDLAKERSRRKAANDKAEALERDKLSKDKEIKRLLKIVANTKKCTRNYRGVYSSNWTRFFKDNKVAKTEQPLRGLQSL